jgi:epoxyqueuosine reductase
MTVVLHACCGPCASACVPRLKAEGHDVTLLFANSNIDTAEEFERRRAAAETLAKADGVPFAVLPYDHEEWLREVAAGYEDAPEKGARCARCYRYNLEKAAAFAAAHGLDAFTTSLTVSPHKPSAVVFAAGESVAPRPPQDQAGPHGRAVAPRPPQFLADDFKKREGFKLSVRRAAELGLYRQSYCGCEFSR